MNSVVNNIFVINNVTASFIYSYFLTTGTLVYWIVSAGVATISGLIAEFRSDWGLITLN